MSRKYRYVECGKNEDGKTCRDGGVTSRSLKALKHLDKCGTLRYVKGYMYFGAYGTTHCAVLVAGDLGSVRFGGFSWGYGGEGPRGLKQLFDRLGITHSPFDQTLGPWPSFHDLREHWRVELPSGELTVHPAPQAEVETSKPIVTEAA